MPPVSFILLIYISWHLLPVDGCAAFHCRGSLEVEPPVPFLMGSNLTLSCHIDDCHISHIYLETPKETVVPQSIVNCTAIFTLKNFQEPNSTVYCKKSDTGTDFTMTGLDLKSGLPPDKAEDIHCETTRTAPAMDCKWKRGKETYINTTYNVMIKKENSSLVQQCQYKESCTIPKEHLAENLKYQLSISAHNHFGRTLSDPLTFSLNDIVIPETPEIIGIDFNNKSLSAFLQWNTSESSENLKPHIRRRAADGHWEEGEGVSVLGEGLVEVAALKPLMNYEFQVRTCSKPFLPTHANPRFVTEIVCSKWSLSFWTRSPGKGPSQPVFVWRNSVMTMENGRQKVTVFWKPPPSDDFSGEIHRFEIILGDGQTQEEVCSALSHCSATVPLLRPISVTAVTSYGTSPPATVPLTLSDAPGPVWESLSPAVDGRSVTLSWACPEHNHELLNYVTEWSSVPPEALLWQTVSRGQRNTTVTGLEPGVLYNISIYTVTTGGVSAPSSSVLYSKELKPISGPVMSVLAHEWKRILVQWEELPVEQRRGFIQSYTIYYNVLESSSSQLRGELQPQNKAWRSGMPNTRPVGLRRPPRRFILAHEAILKMRNTNCNCAATNWPSVNFFITRNKSSREYSLSFTEISGEK